MTSWQWNNEERWVLACEGGNLDRFVTSYVGNGRLGVRFNSHVLDWSDGTAPLERRQPGDTWGRLDPDIPITLARHLYDGGSQLIAPAWNRVSIRAGGKRYDPRQDKQLRARIELDLRTGEARLRDEWEYAPGRRLQLAAELLVPRGEPHVSRYRISVACAEPVEIEIGLDISRVKTHYSAWFEPFDGGVIGRYLTASVKRQVAQGLCWRTAGLQSTGSAATDRNFNATFRMNEGECRLEVLHSLHSDMDGPDPHIRARADLARVASLPDGTIEAENERRWREIWRRALRFEHHDPEIERLVLLQQFHLLCSLDPDCRHPLGALGLSRPGWQGSQLWDADLWLFRALLPLWPELARPIVEYRHRNLPTALAHARSKGYKGAWFDWMTAEDGRAITSPMFAPELHLNIWIALAAWEYAQTTGDRDFLARTAWPLISALADFWCSRAERDADGKWHIRRVVGPDEHVCECGPGACDDNHLTNVGVRRVLAVAREAARDLGREPPAIWNEVEEELVLQEPSADGVIPEYTGYNGESIKQADTILAFYPLGFPTEPDVIRKTLAYYHGKVSAAGPLMNDQIEACLQMKHGDKNAALAKLFAAYREFVRGPLMVPFECRDNDNSLMLTGIGGLLQALIFGYFGSDTTGRGLPRIGDAW